MIVDGLQFAFPDIARQLRRVFDERAKGLNVTRPQWRALLQLARHEGCNQGALADLLEVEPITLCRMVDRLAESGLVERRSDPQDRRAWRLYLLPKARPLLMELQRIGAALFEDAMQGIDAEEQQKLLDKLDKIRENLARCDADRVDND
ncbi:MarR family winged helix-turn-helix transcriptional regulator [Aquisediminimonas sediminicola]|uniref:MarR family winged helix-turn-helix transcriptional regulator n=1 Tax=Alteraquisediminimonas sediminicola TaxID=2676787 RepID=UPI001C8EB882|nr:MarR family transcriptional regulator [Aquisediminimonas sediminicola]